MRSPFEYWRRYRRTRGLTRELLTLSLCLVVGLLVMPVLIWIVGHIVLGPYTNGGLFSLLKDYYLALATGALAYWLVALGPYAAVWLLRGLRLWFRGA
jgi:hypothetical protein